MDLLGGPLSLPIVSARLRTHLEKLQIPDNEFKKLRFAPDFFLLNFFKSHNCISLEQSVGWTRDADGWLQPGAELVIAGSESPQAADVFRLDGTSNCILFTDAAAQSFVGKGFRGLAFLQIKCVAG